MQRKARTHVVRVYRKERFIDRENASLEARSSSPEVHLKKSWSPGFFYAQEWTAEAEAGRTAEREGTVLRIGAVEAGTIE